jgi:transposase
MGEITAVGLDLAKAVFQVHAVDAEGRVVVRRQVRRPQLVKFFAGLPPCLIGMEACATAHYWARELTALGHEIRLMPPAYVKPYVKRQKNDAADAEAICEAVTRPSMRFVPVKSAEQQSVLMLHRVRALLIRQRTMLVNALRGHLAEFGIIVAQGISRIRELIQLLTDESADAVLPPLARHALAPLVDQLLDLQPRIRALEAELLAWPRQSQESRRLETIPGVGLCHRRGSCRHGDRSIPLPLRPGVCRVAGADAPSELIGRQGAVGADLEDG